MRKINVADRTQLKQILRARGVLCIADDEHQLSEPVQLWWHNTDEGVCDCREYPNSGAEEEPEHVSLNKALKVLWRNRGSLYLCGKHPNDTKAV